MVLFSKEGILSLGLIQDTTEVTTPPAATTPAATTPAAAAGSSLAPTLMIGIMILIAVLIIAAVVIGWRTGGTGGAGRYSWLDYGNFFIVAIGMTVVLFAFLVAIGSATDLGIFNDPTEVLAMLTALFGVIAALVGTYFGVKAGSDAAAGAQDLANSAIAPTQAPTVVSVDPLPNAGGGSCQCSGYCHLL
jgi:hypothetical protein